MNEIESAVLGTLIDYYGEAGVAVDAIDRMDFESAAARSVFDVVTNSAAGNSGQTDLPLILQYLSDRAEHDERTGATSGKDNAGEKLVEQRGIILDLSGKVVGTSQFGSYLERLKENRRRRELLKALASAQADLNGNGNAQVIEGLQRRIREIYGGATEYSTADTLRETIDELEADQKDGIQFKTGFNAFDETWGGIFPKELYVIGGDSGHYKTTLTLNLVRKGLEDGKKVLWFDREMGRKRLMRHYLCIVSGVEIWRLRKKVMRPEDWARISDVVGMVEKQQFIIVDDVTTLPKMAETIMRNRPDVVVIDNIQNMDFPKDDNFWKFQMGIVAIKDMAMNYEVAIIALSQVSGRTPADINMARPPTVENLFGGRAIKHNADAVTIVHWPYKDKISEQKSRLMIYHVKMREEGIAQHEMEIDPEHGLVADKSRSRSAGAHPAFQQDIPVSDEDQF